MRIGDYCHTIEVRPGGRYARVVSTVYDFNLKQALVSTNYKFIFGELFSHRWRIAKFSVEKSNYLISCRITPDRHFLGLDYCTGINDTNKILNIHFPARMNSVIRFVDKIRKTSAEGAWQLRIKLQNPVDQFARQRALDAQNSVPNL